MCATISPATHRIAVVSQLPPPAPAERCSSGSVAVHPPADSPRSTRPLASSTSTPCQIFSPDMLYSSLRRLARGLKRLRAHARSSVTDRAAIRVRQRHFCRSGAHDFQALPFLLGDLHDSALPSLRWTRTRRKPPALSRPRRSVPPHCQSSSESTREIGPSTNQSSCPSAAVKVTSTHPPIPRLAKVHRNDVPTQPKSVA